MSLETPPTSHRAAPNAISIVQRSQQFQFRIVEKVSKVGIIHHVDRDGTVWGSRERKILRKRPGSDWQIAGEFPRTLPRDLVEFSRLWARAARSDKSNLFVNSFGNVLAIRAGTAYGLREGQLNPLTHIQGDSVLSGGIAEDQEGWSHFGEYFRNRVRGPVRLWRADPEVSRCELAHEFPAGKIRHIHSVFRDPYDPSALWLSVGDYERECYFIRTRDRFRSLEYFGDGTQIWRAVALFFTEAHICWLTDSEVDQNRACRMRRSTGELELGQYIDNSTWYGTTFREGISIAFTTVETGPGIHRNESSVLVSTDAFQWEEVHSFKKDLYRPIRLFKYGVISCPSGTMSASDFWLSGEGLVGFDGLSLRCTLERK